MLVDDLSNKDLKAAVDAADTVARVWPHICLAGYRGSIASPTVRTAPRLTTWM